VKSKEQKEQTKKQIGHSSVSFCSADVPLCRGANFLSTIKRVIIF
jgi:hypothetical protein